MSLTVVTDTPSFTPVRNPVHFEVLCGGFVTTAATTSVYGLAIASTPADASTFSISIGGTVIPFRFTVATPDDSGTQILIGADDAETKDNLIAAFQANWYIREYFDVTDGGLAAALTAREPGALDVAFIAGTAPVAWGASVVGADAVVAQDYSANYALRVEEDWDSGVYAIIPTQTGYPNPKDTIKRTRWDLRTLLKPFVGHQWPTYGITTMLRLLNMQRRYYIERWEEYGDPVTPRRVYKSVTKRAWFAGSRNIERDVLTEVFSFCTTVAPNYFLTYRGRAGKHEVSRTQHSFLGWYRRTAVVTSQPVKLLFEVTYTDASTAAVVKSVDTGNTLKQSEVGLFPCGFDRQNLGALEPTLTPRKYTATVVAFDGTTALSETHTFYLVPEDENELHIAYINSLGVPEMARGDGQWSIGMEVEFEPLQRLRPVIAGVKPSPQESDRVQVLTGAQQRIVWGSGFMDRGELDALIDMLVSPELKLQDHDREMQHPLHLVSGTEHVVRTQGNNGEHLYALNLELLLHDAEMAWSARAQLPALEDEGDPDPPDV